jgi:hypothetical protein
MGANGSDLDPTANGHTEQAPAKTTRGAVRYRDGLMAILNVLRREQVQLRRAGFLPYLLTLVRIDGSRVQSELWMQDRPTLADYLNAAYLLFDDVPGSLYWDAEPNLAGGGSFG